MMYRNGTYYLFYSSSWVQLSSYHVGVARADNVMGPFSKRNIPVLQNDWDRLMTMIYCQNYHSFVGIIRVRIQLSKDLAMEVLLRIMAETGGLSMPAGSLDIWTGILAE